MTKQLFSNIAPTGQTANSNTYRPQNSSNESGYFQVEYVGGATGTVTLYGRVSANAPWVSVVALMAGDIKIVPLMPEMYVALTDYSGGTGKSINAWIAE